MNPLLEQFLSESRECLEGIGAKLMELERDPSNAELMTSLFRLVHTLKGNSGLFDYREMTRVLHAGEDLMDAVRHGRVAYSQELADRLLDAMDFVGVLCDEIEASGELRAVHASDSARLAESLREFLARVDVAGTSSGVGDPAAAHSGASQSRAPDDSAAGSDAGVQDETTTLLATVPVDVLADAARRAASGDALCWVTYSPDEQCFFQGDDPFFLARNTPHLLWGGIVAREQWPSLAELDAYRCILDFRLLTAATSAELDEHFRYVPDQIVRTAITAQHLAAVNAGPGASVATAVADADAEALRELLDAQRQILALPVASETHRGRLRGVAATLAGCARATGRHSSLAALDRATAQSVADFDTTALSAWLEATFSDSAAARGSAAGEADKAVTVNVAPPGQIDTDAPTNALPLQSSEPETDAKFGRRAEDAAVAPRSLKVDQEKIDRLMNLIGEMIVSKNALPYLANRAETVFGSRELSREIKAQYAVINRIAEEMQDAIMQVRMMPVSFVFQRFPRLVRDISRKLGKEVHLVLEGEDTEADKNIIEALSDPLIHIVRNSLDHGIEVPEVRRAQGKSAAGTLTIRAQQESDRVVIEIRDDGKGIDPLVVKRKAYEKGLIDEQTLDRISDQEAIQLIFAAGFSTMDAVSDLSGRGVGMDVVRTAIERVNGTVALDSVPGRGTRIRLSLPLSMAVTNVMIVESDGKSFGVPMECVVETVRVPLDSLHTIKQRQAMVLRGEVIPLQSLNGLLEVGALQRTNASSEHAVLVVRVGDETVGLMVDEFRGTSDVILKPMAGVLAGLSAYAGSALMGDGSVLMVLNLKELV